MIEELDYKERSVKLWDSDFIISGEKTKKETGKGKIVALWSQAKDLEIWDIVYFNRYVPQEVEIEWVRYLSMPWKDVQAKEVN